MDTGRLLARSISIAPSPIGGLSEPLIPKSDGAGAGESDDNDESAKDPSSSIAVIIGSVLLGGAGIAASAAAMVSTAGMVAVYIAGGICVTTSITVVKNQYEMSKCKGYRQGINFLRREGNRLHGEVDTLVKAIDDLQMEAELMKTFEQQLSEIAREQGVSVEKIVSLTKENEEILAKQKDILKQIFLSDVAKAFISSDFLSADMKVDLKNLPLLMMRLEIQLNSHGMNLDTAQFEKMVRQNNDVGHIIKCCGEMLNKDGSGNSSQNKVANLVTLDADHTKGSLELARGMKPSLSTKPELEHRNTVVRDVKRGLNVKSRVSSNINYSVGSDYEEESAYADHHHTRKHRVSGFQDNAKQESEAKSKRSSKFQATARISRLQSGEKPHSEASSRASSRDSAISQQHKRETKGILKSTAVMAAVTPKRKPSLDGKRSSSESKGRMSRRKSSEGFSLKNSFTGNASSTKSLGRARSVDRRHSGNSDGSPWSLRKSKSVGRDPGGVLRKSATSSQSTPDLRMRRKRDSASHSTSLAPERPSSGRKGRRSFQKEPSF